MDPSGPFMTPLSPSGPLWILLDPSGTFWIPLDLTGSLYTNLDHWIWIWIWITSKPLDPSRFLHIIWNNIFLFWTPFGPLYIT